MTSISFTYFSNPPIEILYKLTNFGKYPETEAIEIKIMSFFLRFKIYLSEQVPTFQLSGKMTDCDVNLHIVFTQ